MVNLEGVLGVALHVVAFATGAVCLETPVVAPIVASFVEPRCPYCPGHRSVDFAVPPLTVIRAPVTGVVTFVGDVVGTHYVTIAAAIDDSTADILVTVGFSGDGSSPIRVGSVIHTGDVVGSSVASRVRLSMRRLRPGLPALYLDPEPFLVRWRAPIRLIPLDGRPGPAVRAVRTCRRHLSIGD